MLLIGAEFTGPSSSVVSTSKVKSESVNVTIKVCFV